MSRRVRLALTTALLLVGSRAAAAQSFTVLPVALGPITVTAAVAGSDPTPVSNGSTTYTLATKKNSGFTRVTANINAPLPAGVTLTINVTSPGGGIVSAGPVSLTTAPQDVLTSLPKSNTTFPPTAITYTLSATAAAGVVAVTPTLVTFTQQ